VNAVHGPVISEFLKALRVSLDETRGAPVPTRKHTAYSSDGRRACHVQWACGTTAPLTVSTWQLPVAVTTDPTAAVDGMS
jgi:hypothetical protein